MKDYAVTIFVRVGDPAALIEHARAQAQFAAADDIDVEMALRLLLDHSDALAGTAEIQDSVCELIGCDDADA